MPEFRNILEGQGGVFERNPAGATRMIGTWRCISCVGIYFRIDEIRCFVAHINVVSHATWGAGVVTQNNVPEIRDQVLHRLCGFLRRYNWDTSNRYFGQELTVVCPYYHYLRWPGYRTVGYCAIEGIKQFFKHCARALEYERSHREDISDDEAMRLPAKAAFLREHSTDLKVDYTHHGFAFDPATEEAKFFSIRDRNNPQEDDLEGYRPRDDAVIEGNPDYRNFTIFAMSDRPDTFPLELRANPPRNYQRDIGQLQRLALDHANITRRPYEVFPHVEDPHRSSRHKSKSKSKPESKSKPKSKSKSERHPSPKKKNCVIQ